MAENKSVIEKKQIELIVPRRQLIENKWFKFSRVTVLVRTSARKTLTENLLPLLRENKKAGMYACKLIDDEEYINVRDPHVSDAVTLELLFNIR